MRKCTPRQPSGAVCPPVTPRHNLDANAHLWYRTRRWGLAFGEGALVTVRTIRYGEEDDLASMHSI